MLGATIVGISTLLQFAAAFVALRLMHITGKSISWGLISLAIFLMAIRRSATLLKIMQGQQQQNFDLSIELIALLISVLMLAGLALISPLFKSMNINMAMLKKTRQEAIDNERKLYNITSSLAEGIYVIDEQGSLVFMNNEAETLTGWKFDELKDKDIHKTLHYRNDFPTESTKVLKMLSIFKNGEKYSSMDDFFTRKDGSEFPVSVISSPIIEDGKITSVVTAFRDLTIRKKLEKDREELIQKLQHSLQTIKTLQGILPICASCKKIRNDKGYWIQIENYITHHSGVDFSHGICPECAAVLYPEYCDAATPSTKKNESSNS